MSESTIKRSRMLSSSAVALAAIALLLAIAVGGGVAPAYADDIDIGADTRIVVAGTTGNSYTGAALDPITISNPNETPQWQKYGPNVWSETATWLYQYKVAYENNVYPGTASYTITGSGSQGCTGTLSGEFEIAKGDMSKGSVTLASGEKGSYLETGETIIPKVNVSIGTERVWENWDWKDKAVELPESDYTLVIKDEDGNVVSEPKAAGTYTIEAQAKSENVEGTTQAASFTIIGEEGRLTLEGATFSHMEGEYSWSQSEVSGVQDQVWTRGAIEPDFILKDASGNTLEKDVDYTVAYSDNTEVGTATVTVTGKGIYKGTATTTFAIGKRDIATAEASILGLAGYDSLPYTGAEQKPAVSVGVAGTELVAGVDYEVTYTNTKDIWKAENLRDSDETEENYPANKQPTVTITGKGNCEGSKELHFSIVPAANIATAVFRSDPSLTFNGAIQAITPADWGIAYIDLLPKYSICSYGLRDAEGVAYTVSYQDANGNQIAAEDIVGAGSYKMVLTGLESGGFYGTKTIDFSIAKADFSKIEIADIPVQAIGVDPELDVTLTSKVGAVEEDDDDDDDDDDYWSWLDDDDDDDDDDASDNAADGDSASGEEAVDDDAVDDDAETVVYHLVKDVDYEVTFTGNDQAGRARAVLKAKDGGNFTGNDQYKYFTVGSNEQMSAIEALSEGIESAEAIEQGGKSKTAFVNLQLAIAAAEALYAEALYTDAEAGPDIAASANALAVLSEAVEAFEDSADAVQAKVAFYKAGTYGTAEEENSHAGASFDSTALLVDNGDDTYTVELTATASASSMLTKMCIGEGDSGLQAVSLGEGVFALTLTHEQLVGGANTGMYIDVPPYHSGWQQADMVLPDYAASVSVEDAIENLPAIVTVDNMDQVEAAWEAFNNLSWEQKALVPAETVQALQTAHDAAVLAPATEQMSKLEAQIAALQKANTSLQSNVSTLKKQKVTTVVINVKTVNATTVAKAIEKAGGDPKYVTNIVIGAKATKISANAFKGCTKCKTITIKGAKLAKASAVKGALKNSKVTRVKVPKSKLKAYKKVFVKKTVGKKVSVASS